MQNQHVIMYLFSIYPFVLKINSKNFINQIRSLFVFVVYLHYVLELRRKIWMKINLYLAILSRPSVLPLIWHNFSILYLLIYLSYNNYKPNERIKINQTYPQFLKIKEISQIQIYVQLSQGITEINVNNESTGYLKLFSHIRRYFCHFNYSNIIFSRLLKIEY